MSTFRNVKVSGQEGKYEVKGEAKLTTGKISYTIEDGHKYLEKGSIQVEPGNDSWKSFEMNLFVPKEYLPAFGVLTMTLYEVGAETGQEINEESFTLDELNESELT